MSHTVPPRPAASVHTCTSSLGNDRRRLGAGFSRAHPARAARTAPAPAALVALRPLESAWCCRPLAVSRAASLQARGPPGAASLSPSSSEGAKLVLRSLTKTGLAGGGRARAESRVCPPQRQHSKLCHGFHLSPAPPPPACPPAPSFEAWAQAPWEIQDMLDVNWMRISFHLTLPEFKSYRGSGCA